MLHSGGKDTSIGKGRKLFFSQAHDVYTHHQETTKQTPAPSLHKDSNLGVPTSPLRLYLRGLERIMVW
jgi:hypothetical protein